MRGREMSILLVAALAACGPAEAKSRHKSHHHSATQAVSTTTAPTDPAAQCKGGVLITADDQIRGCTTLMKGRLSGSERATAFYNRGNALMKKKRIAEAIADFESALALHADYPEVFFNRSIAYQIIQDRSAALADLDTYLRLVPTDADALAMRGGLMLSSGKDERAAKDLEAALVINPRHEAALVNRGHLKVRARQFPEALQDYEAVLAMNPANAEALYGRGVVRAVTGRASDGNADMLQAVTIDASVDGRLAALGVTTVPKANP